MPEAYVLVRIKDDDRQEVLHAIRVLRGTAHAYRRGIADFSVMEDDERPWHIPNLFSWLKAIFDEEMAFAKSLRGRRGWPPQ